MYNSIKYFEEKCINKFEKLEDNFMREPQKLAEYVLGLTEELYNLGLKMIQQSLEEMNEMLRKSQKRLQHWVVESHDTKQLITSLGTVTYKKTLFTNKETGKSEYLLSVRIIGLEKHERISEDALARMLKEAVQTSYRRGGEETSLTTEVEKQTVKNKIHALKFPQNTEKPKKKKEVEYLYIEADEDHVSLPFREKKGDLERKENHQKNNGLITKLVYVHEGIEKEAPQSKRHKLVNAYYFCGTSYGEENTAFWDEVYEYIRNHYDLGKVKKIYVNADGGGWIKSGMKRIAGMTYVLDEFHLEKYLTKLTSHMKDSREDAADELRAAINIPYPTKLSHKQNTNEGKTSEDGIWFGTSEPDDSKGALLYDTYMIEEMSCDSNKMVITKNPTISSMPAKSSYEPKVKESDGTVDAATTEEVTEFLETFFKLYPTATDKELSYYVADGGLKPVNMDYLYSELINPLFTMDGDKVKVDVSVKYLDKRTKAAQISQFELMLAKTGGNWKIVG